RLYFAFGRPGIMYRPLSSVTTTLAYGVGVPVVSAITQTPASGPFGPDTVPPRSVRPTFTGGLSFIESFDLAFCRAACDGPARPASSSAIAAQPRNDAIAFMQPP